jgi:hypothetical protein
MKSDNKILMEMIEQAVEEQGQLEGIQMKIPDHEGRMAKGELRDMIKNGLIIYKSFDKNDELPGWVSAYITLASDYMHSVMEYMVEGNQDEQSDSQEAGNFEEEEPEDVDFQD